MRIEGYINDPHSLLQPIPATAILEDGAVSGLSSNAVVKVYFPNLSVLKSISVVLIFVDSTLIYGNGKGKILNTIGNVMYFETAMPVDEIGEKEPVVSYVISEEDYLIAKDGGAVDYSAAIQSLVASMAEMEASLTAAGNVIPNLQADSYVLVLTDSSKMIRMNKATAQNLTIPPFSSVAFALGAQILIDNSGAGQVTVVAGLGVTINSADGNLKLRVQHSTASLIKVDVDIWKLMGDLTS